MKGPAAMTHQTQSIPSDTTVNDAVRRWPGTVNVFNRFGIDACCGGATPIREAAVRDGADPEQVLDAVLRVIRGEST